MTCETTSSTDTGAKCDKSCSGDCSTAGSGCKCGSLVWPSIVAEMLRQSSTQMPQRSGPQETEVLQTIGDDPDRCELANGWTCCTGNCRQGRDCPARDAMVKTGPGAARLMVVLLVVFWACIVTAVRSCAT